jgi:Pentapeptide repeats (8 copies)
VDFLKTGVHWEDARLVTQRIGWPVVVGMTGFLAVVLVSLVLIPQLVYPSLTETDLQGVTSANARIELQQAQGQLQNNVRATLLQAVAGALIVVGALATWRQVQVNREGQITERFTRAVDQLGSDSIDVRIGGIYALERVARNSMEDRPQVQYILGAFVRGHAPWPANAPNGPEHPTRDVDRTLPWLYARAPDVQAAVNVLGRRRPSPEALRPYLSRVDLRSVNLTKANLANATIRHTNMARAWLADATFDGAELHQTDLRQAKAIRTRFVNAILCGAYLEGADLTGADLSGADLRGTDMRARHLDQARLTGALVDATTIWPADFDHHNAIHGKRI